MNDEKYMQVAFEIAKQSTCYSEPKGAIIVKNDVILATGYNNVPISGMSCRDKYGYCYRRKLGFQTGEGLEFCRGIHAEAAAICEAARKGYSVEGAILFTTHFPCNECAKLIVNAGIIKVCYQHEYSSCFSSEILRQGNVSVLHHRSNTN